MPCFECTMTERGQNRFPLSVPSSWCVFHLEQSISLFQFGTIPHLISGCTHTHTHKCADKMTNGLLDTGWFKDVWLEKISWRVTRRFQSFTHSLGPTERTFLDMHFKTRVRFFLLMVLNVTWTYTILFRFFFYFFHLEFYLFLVRYPN